MVNQLSSILGIESGQRLLGMIGDATADFGVLGIEGISARQHFHRTVQIRLVDQLLGPAAKEGTAPLAKVMAFSSGEEQMAPIDHGQTRFIAVILNFLFAAVDEPD